MVSSSRYSSSVTASTSLTRIGALHQAVKTLLALSTYFSLK